MAMTTTQTLVSSDKLSFKKSHITFHDLPTPQEIDLPLPPPSFSPTGILDIDKGTPDHHVPRDSRLIRLTGVHPFNVEAPLTTLYNQGTIIHISSAMIDIFSTSI
jgi:nitrate reductase (NAD(P)H)